MIGLFVALGIAILTLLAVLLWFVPHLLQQQALRVEAESSELRELINEMISEQEAVAMRQVQLGTSISYLQDQLEQIVTTGGAGRGHTMLTDIDVVQTLDARMSGLQMQVDRYMRSARVQTRQENESWIYLLGLLDAMQERLHTLSEERASSRQSQQRNQPYRNGQELSGHHSL